MNRRILILLILSVVTLCNKVLGQGEANVWYFGNGAGLDFNSNPPAQYENGNANLSASPYEGVGSMCDANGNLLFYTDGMEVFDKNHNEVPSTVASNLAGGDGEPAQSGLCLPVNGSSTQYFIISTNDATKNTFYSIMDMTLNGGLGDISTKNSPLVSTATASEAALAVPVYDAANNPTGESWIIFHEYNSDLYWIYKTNGAAINFVTSYHVGFISTGQTALLLKTNACFNKIAASFFNFGRVEVLPFNNVTGLISTPSIILDGYGAGMTFLNRQVYGIEFAPNDQFLYVSESGYNGVKTVYQFDISLGTGFNPPAVIASKSSYTGDANVVRFGHLQLGPDGKIYVPGFNFALPTYLSVIPNPNVAWTIPTPTATEFEYLKYTYAVKNTGQGLPVFSQALLRQIRIFYNNACEGGTTNFSYTFGGAAVSISWDFGDPASGVLNTSTSATPSHIYSTAGTYTATLTIVDNCGRTRIGTVNVIVKSGPTYSLPGTTCPNTNITVTGTGAAASSYIWSLSPTMSSPSGPSSTYIYNGALPATVYVQDPTPLATYTAATIVPAGSQASDVGDTRFELFQTVLLNSVNLKVRTTGATGTIVLYEWNGAAWVATTGSEAFSQAYNTGATLNSVQTITINRTLNAGIYRLWAGDVNDYYKNVATPFNGNSDVNGVINIIGDTDSPKGGPYYNFSVSLPDPCGIRAITIPLNCCVVPTITTQPSSQSVCANTAVSFTVATSAGSPTYQWQVSTNGGGTWTDIGGATSATYSIAAGSVTSSINNYQYRAKINPSGCFATSNAATLTVKPLPNVTNSPLTATVCEGTAWAGVTLTADIAGTTFAWTSAASAGITGNTASGSGNLPTQTFTHSGTTAGTVTYTVTPTANSCPGTAVNYVVTVNPLPTITNTPLTATNCEGTSWAGVILTADVAGTTFAWTSAASAGITGNTASGTGNLPTQTFANSGTSAGTVTYTITPTANGCPGAAVNYVVTVNPLPTVTNSPLTASICEGTAWSGVTLTADVAGTTFAWTSAASAGITGNTASGSGNLPTQTFANSGTTAGTVTYIITPTAGTCPGTAVNYVVSANPIPTVTNSPLTATVCEGTSWSGITLTADVAGSTFAWTSAASAGITGNTASGTGNIPSQTFANSGTSAGTVTYTVTATANTCPSTTVNYVVTVNPAPTVTNSPLTASVCEGTAWAGVTLTADVAGTTFAWTSSATAGITGNTASGSGNLPSQTFANSGTTSGTVTYTITPTAGTCPGTAVNYVVTVNPLPTVTNSPLTTAVCEGTAWSGATVTADVAGTTFAWTSSASAGITGNTASGSGNLPSQTFANSGTTSGTVNYTITPTAGTCAGTAVNYVVTVNPVPTITNSPLTAAVCNGVAWGGLTITADVAGSTFAWTSAASAGITGNTASGSGNIPSQTYTNTSGSTGTVTYTITPTAGTCPGTAVNYVVSVGPPPTITNSPLTTSVCEGTAWAGLTLTADLAGTTFAWTSSASAGITGNTASGSGNLPSQTFANSGTTAGTVTYTITPTAGTCVGTAKNYVVTVNPLPTVTNSPLTASICEGTAWSGVVLTADIAGTTFAWTSSATAGITGNSASGTGNIPTQTFANSGTTSGTVTYTITPTAGTCAGTAVNYVVTVNPIPTVTNSPLSALICEGTAWSGVTLTADIAGTTFAWTSTATVGITGNSASGTGNIPTQTFANSGTTSGTVTYTITPTAGTCPGTAVNYVVTVNPIPTVTNSPLTASVCEGTAWSGLTIAADVAGTTFSWTSTATAGITGNSASGTGNIPTQTFANSGTTSGTVTYTTTPTAGTCPGTSVNYVVTVNPLPTVTNSPLTAATCEGTAWAGVTLTADVAGTTFAWTSTASAGITGNTASGAGNIPTQTYSNSGSTSGTVTYAIIPSNGACAGTVTNYVVTVNPTPTTTNSPLTDAVCNGVSWAGVTLTADVAGTTFAWTSTASAGITGNTASGIGNIPSQNYTNTSGTTATVTYSITATAGTCIGPVTNFVVSVGPPPSITNSPLSTTVCEGTAWSGVTLTADLAGTTFSWTSSASAGITGNTASGTGNLPSQTFVNSGTTAGTVTYTITPKAGTCTGTVANYVVTVNPTPVVTNSPLTDNVCEGTAWSGVNLTTDIAGTTFAWTSSASAGITGNTASGTGNISSQTFANSGVIAGTVTFAITPTAGTCTGSVSNFIVTVNPAPAVTNSPLTANVCEGTAWSGVALSADVAGTTFAWTSTASAGITGNTASGTGNISSQTFANSGSTAGTVTYSITPTAGTCAGTVSNFIVTVNPSPVVTNAPLTDNVCEGTSWSGVILTSDVAGATFSWTSSASAGITGNTASGTGNISSQTFANSGTTAGTVTYSVTPTIGTCSGIVSNYVVTVNPAPIVTNSPLTDNVCEGTAWSGVTLTSDVAGATFAWTSTATAGISGNNASGTGNIPTQTFSNSGSTSGTVTYTITPTAGTCPGTVSNFIVTVNPAPGVTNSPLTATVCEGTAWSGVNLTADVAGATFAWTSTATAGITGNTASGTGNIPAQTFSNSGITSGTVTYAITPTGGTCPGVVSNFVVTVNPTPVVTNSPLTDNVCEGTSWSGVALTADIAGTTFAWTSTASAGITGNTAIGTGNISSQTFANSGVIAGTVTFAITPTAGTCTGSVSNFIVTVNPAPVVTNSPLTDNVCEGTAWSGVTLSADVAGTTFAWSSSASAGITGNTASGTGNISSQTFANSGSTAGTVTYSITPTAGTCAGTVSNFIVTVNPSPVVTNAPLTDNVCEGTSWSGVILTSDVAGATFSWTSTSSAGITGNTASGIGDIASQTFANSGTTAGTVTFAITPKAGTCSGAVSNFVVTVNPAPAVTNSPLTDNVCEGTAWSGVSLTADVAGTTFAWTSTASAGITGNTASGTGNISSQTFANSGTTSGTVSFAITPTAGSCPGSVSNFVVTVNPTPIITNSPLTDITCEGTAWAGVILTSDVAGTNFAWTSSATAGVAGNTASGTGDISSQTYSNSGSTAGTVTYVVAPTAGTCLGTASNFVVTVNPKPIVTNSPLTANACSGTAWAGVTVTADVAGTNFVWTSTASAGITGNTASGTGNLPSETFTNGGVTPGTVTYTITPNAATCVGTSSNFVVTVNPSPTVTTSPLSTSVCEGTSWAGHTLTADVAGTTFAWTSSASATITGNTTNGTGNLPSQSFINSNPNLVGTVTYVITPSNGACLGTPANYVVSITPTTVGNLTITPTDVCQGDVSSVSIASTQAHVTYQTIINGNPVGSIVQGTGGTITLLIAANDLTPGSNPITINAVGCDIATMTTQVTVLGNPGTISGLDNPCDNATTGLNYSIAAVPGAASYNWTPAGIVTSGQGTTSVTVNLGATSPQTITVTPVTSGGLQCNSPFITVTQKPSYSGLDKLVIDEDSICKGNTITISIANQSAESYIWPTTLPTGASYVTNGSTSRTVNFGTAGIYTLSVQPVHQCNPTITPITTANLVIIEPPIASAGGDVDLSKYQPVTLNGTGSSVGSVYAYEWTSNPSSTISSPKTLITSVTPNATSTDYTLRVYTKNTKGCEASDVMQIEVDFVVKIPNAFSPNGDGNHDQFVIQNIQYFPNAKLYIYNQWGELIYTSDSGYPEAWDGKRNGNDVPVSAYFYVLEFNEGDKKAMTGEINVIR